MHKLTSGTAKFRENQTRQIGKGNQWSAGSVKGILINEKFCGDVRNQKTYTEDYLTHRTVKNTGQRNMYYIRDHHR